MTAPMLTEVDHALRAVIAQRTEANRQIAELLIACHALDEQIDRLLAMRTEAITRSVPCVRTTE